MRLYTIQQIFKEKCVGTNDDISGDDHRLPGGKNDYHLSGGKDDHHLPGGKDDHHLSGGKDDHRQSDGIKNNDIPLSNHGHPGNRLSSQEESCTVLSSKGEPGNGLLSEGKPDNESPSMVNKGQPGKELLALQGADGKFYPLDSLGFKFSDMNQLIEEITDRDFSRLQALDVFLQANPLETPQTESSELPQSQPPEQLIAQSQKLSPEKDPSEQQPQRSDVSRETDPSEQQQGSDVSPDKGPSEQRQRSELSRKDDSSEQQLQFSDLSSLSGLSPEDVRICSPITTPGQDIICLGVNYREHIDETVDTTDFSNKEAAVYFSKRANRMGGDGDPIPYYDFVDSLDYEVELAVILGKTVKDISIDEALDCIFGYSVFNDVSARNLQFRHQQWYRGKSLDGYSIMGPCIVTADEIENAQDLDISCTVNGQVRQSSNTSLMLTSICEAISELSSGMTLRAGTIIATGTPGGVGLGMKPPKYLKVGDEVECRIDGIGSIVNTVTAV